MMNNTEAEQQEEFEFDDSKDWLTRGIHWLSRKLVSALGLSILAPPIVYKKTGLKNWLDPQRPNLTVLGKITGLNDPEHQKTLTYHNLRFRIYKIILSTIYFVFGISISFPILFSVNILSLNVYRMAGNFIAINQNLYRLLLSSVMLLFLFVCISIAFRIASILTDRHYAETLCVVSCLYFLVELGRNDVLSHPDHKKSLLLGLNNLVRNVRLMTLCYDTKDTENQFWLRKHFKNMELFILERERWIIAPTSTTLSDLRKDFLVLGNMFLNGRYGDYTWKDELANSLHRSEKPKSSKYLQIVFQILGVMLPMSILFLLFTQPIVFTSLGIDTTVVALLAFAWLLLVADAYLKLGIVDRVTGLAKAIKDLS